MSGSHYRDDFLTFVAFSQDVRINRPLVQYKFAA